MEVINLPNGETFRTSNEEAAEFIRGIVSGEVTMAGLKALDGEAKDIVITFCNWNNVYADYDTETLSLKEKLVNTWKMSGYDMTFDEFIGEFYVRVEWVE